MGKLIYASWKMLLRDRQNLFWALAFPVIFAVVFGLFDFDRPPEVRIGVVAERPTQLSESLVRGLREIPSFEVTTSRRFADERTKLQEGERDVVLGVPASVPLRGADAEARGPLNEEGAVSGHTPGQTPPARIEVLFNGSNFEENQFALSVVRRIVDATNLRLAGVASPALEIRERAVDGKAVDYYDFLLPGLVAMGVMNFSIIGMSVAIARFREQRILRRILATPLSPARFLAAQVIARLALAVIQAALILAVGVYVFDANIYGNVLWLFVLATFANLIFLNIGFAVAGRASNPDAAQGVGNAVALPMMFLSGVFFPTDTLPQVMQTIVRYLPLTPLIEAMRKVSIDGSSIAETGPELALLGGWVIASFLIASRMFRFART